MREHQDRASLVATTPPTRSQPASSARATTSGAKEGHERLKISHHVAEGYHSKAEPILADEPASLIDGSRDVLTCDRQLCHRDLDARRLQQQCGTAARDDDVSLFRF